MSTYQSRERFDNARVFVWAKLVPAVADLTLAELETLHADLRILLDGYGAVLSLLATSPTTPGVLHPPSGKEDSMSTDRQPNPDAIAYLEAYARAHGAGEVPTGGRGGAAMAAHRALAAWQAGGCRVWVDGVKARTAFEDGVLAAISAIRSTAVNPAEPPGCAVLACEASVRALLDPTE